MAPRKKPEKEEKPEKVEKATGVEGSDMILQYLRRENRPYSAIDVSANLRNRVTKAAAAKLLKDLHEQKLIEGRPSGKQIVYHAIQYPDDAISPDQLTDLDSRTASLTAQTTELTALAKTIQSTLKSLTASLSTADILSSISSLKNERTEIAARLEGLRKGSAQKVTVEERMGVEREWRLTFGVEKRRQRIAQMMWGVVEDGTESKDGLADLREGWGLDE